MEPNYHACTTAERCCLLSTNLGDSMGFLRHPRTTSEKRANQDGWCRGKRSTASLPDVYDDICPATDGHRSWKRHRRTQYRRIVSK